ncbi:MAG: LLM class flavin-dependent oxidoreductase [Dehalococcoidia bacterium]
MPSVQFGLVIPSEFTDPAGPTRLVADADRVLKLAAGHFDSAWVVDHLQAGNIHRLEGFTTLTYLAARHPQFRFGNSVLCHAFRNPALLAKMAATLQMLSGGRFILGMGCGCDEEEHLAYGYEFPDGATRVRQLDEAIQIVKGLWSHPTMTFKGEFYRVSTASCDPRPEPVPPLMVGAFGPQMLRLVARQADWWNASSTGPGRYASMSSTLGRACEALGRDPTTVRRTWCGGVSCAPTRSEAEAQAAGRFSLSDDFDFGFVGTARDIVEQMHAFIELGVDYFMLDVADFPRLDGLLRLIRSVLPKIGRG